MIDLSPKGESRGLPRSPVPIESELCPVRLGELRVVRVPASRQRGTKRISKDLDLSIIERRVRVMGGSPIVAGTRVRVSDVVGHYRLEGRSVAGVKRALPFLTSKQVSAALDYYVRHRKEIDKEIATERALAAPWRPDST